MARRKIINHVRDTWLIFGIILVLLVLIEGIFSLAFLVKDHLTVLDARVLNRQSQPETDSGTSWMGEYTKEMKENSLRWEPYVYWRRKPYNGKYININTNGIRHTSNLQTSHDQEGHSLRVFMFGGSTMWGTNARDAFTIPSLLAKALQGRGMSVEVINFGETGYVSTQEVITLLLQLRKGNIPDVAIFYDGVNDTYSAYQNAIAGIPQNEFNRIKEFNLLNPEKLQELRETFIKGTLNNLSTFRFIKGLLLRLNLRKEIKSIPTKNRLENEESLTEQIISTYIGNTTIIKALASSYGFKSLFYWQPTIFEKMELTEHEQYVYGGEDEQDIKSFYKKTYDVMRKTASLYNDTAFHDVSTIFADVRETIYVDWFHLNEDGNDRIAQTMLEGILPLITSYRATAR
jgi:lysophospholipase L1-like esterase